jgi:hypothetical protein
LSKSGFTVRLSHLAWALRKQHQGIAVNANYDGDGEAIYHHVCTLGCESIVSKRLGSIYRTSRTDQWLKMKNPEAPAAAAPAEACKCLSFSARRLPTAEHKRKSPDTEDRRTRASLGQLLQPSKVLARYTAIA